MPKFGDSFVRGSLCFEVVDLDRRRVDRVLIAPAADPAQPTHGGRELTGPTGPCDLAGLGSVETASMSFVVPQRNQALVIRRARAG